MTVRVAFPFVGDTVGGSHISAALLMRELPAFGFAPVALVHVDGPLADWLRGQGLEVVRTGLPYLPRDVAGARALLKVAFLAPRLAAALRRYGVGIVHANDGRMIASWLPAARLAGLIAVAHARTKWSRSRLAHLTFRAAHRIITISSYVRDALPDDLQGRSVIIPNPIADVRPSRAETREAVLNLVDGGADAFVVAFVGTLQDQKRPGAFLQTAKEILDRRPDVRFLVMGRDGELGDAMRALARQLGISHAVVFAGFRFDASALLAGCDLLLAPAVNEGYGRALVEAMLAGVPVVAAASGGHQAIIRHGETGILTPPDRPELMAEAALELLSQPDTRARMASSARDWAVSNSSPAEHAKAVASLYRTMLRA